MGARGEGERERSGERVALGLREAEGEEEGEVLPRGEGDTLSPMASEGVAALL